MKNFRLIENAKDNTKLIAYEVLVDPDEFCIIYLLSNNLLEDEIKILIGGRLTETKRGWTFISFWLTTKPMKIFLPRQNFTKVEI